MREREISMIRKNDIKIKKLFKKRNVNECYTD